MRNTRIGLTLFGLYLVLYAAFVLIAAFQPEVMEQKPLAGVNVAIWYGFGLIISATVLALVYGWACATKPSGIADESDRDGSNP
jgi:uncharacterized membrane protein (DUF485 family)